MLSDTTRLHKTWFQEIDFLKNLKVCTKSWQILYISGPIQNLKWIQLESTLKNIIMWIEIFSFGYNSTIWNLVKRGLFHTCLRTPWFLRLVPWRRVLRTIWPYETWWKGVSPILVWGPPDFWILCPGGECFAPHLISHDLKRDFKNKSQDSQDS